MVRSRMATRKRLVRDDGSHTPEGIKEFNSKAVEFVTYMIKMNRKGYSVPDTLLLLHETLGAAAQTALNKLSNPQNKR
jgi:hypothetical protein